MNKDIYMQVFCPYANPKKTAKCLDNKRLNKQILECCQILSSITKIDIGWKIPKYIYKHPCTLMWISSTKYLYDYVLILCIEFSKRKSFKKQHTCYFLVRYFFTNFVYRIENSYELKHMNSEFCKKHQELLLEKNYEHYSIYFKKD